MPDWFYRTVGQPLLFRLPDRLARSLALGTLGTLGRFPLGRAVIDLLGHSRPPACLGFVRAGLTFPSPVGFGRRLDPNAQASEGLGRLGAGFVEVGPIATVERGSSESHPEIGDDGTLLCRPSDCVPAVQWWRSRLARYRRRPGLPLLARLAPEDPADFGRLASELHDLADAFVIEWHDARGPIPTPSGDRPWLLAIDEDVADVSERARAASAAGYAGVVLDVEAQRMDGWRRIGEDATPGAWERGLERVRSARAAIGPAGLLVVSQAVRQPRDARQLLAAGADLLQVDTGVVHTGPGLLKRINEALASEREAAGLSPSAPAARPATQGWFWLVVLGAALAAGGLLALVIAFSRVVLPYDEDYLGLTRDGLSNINPRLLDFMAHDRVTLAGAMLGVGALYIGLAWGGVRRGAHWAMVAVASSAVAGFASFFCFLGFGYFDPFHAFVSAVLLQFLLLGIVLPPGAATPERAAPEWSEDARWRWAQWGQLLLVVHAVGLLIAGATICTIGIGRVFVSEDLRFLGMTAGALRQLGDHLVPVVAHDRASLGGMLLAAGLGSLLPVLWGVRRGRAWLWWTLLALGVPAYACTLGIHLHVGYTDWRHLLPAFIGAALYAGGLGLLRPYLAERK